MTALEYLEFEETATDRHEYHDGKVLAMSGGSSDHSRINTNAIVAIGNALKGRTCANFESGLRIRIPSINRYLYADQSIICGPLEFDHDDPQRRSVTNPRVILEVLSPFTENYDRGEKFEMFRAIVSLEEYVLISETSPRVDSFVRGERDGMWTYIPFSGLGATLPIATVDVRIALADLYEDVELPPPGMRERFGNSED